MVFKLVRTDTEEPCKIQLPIGNHVIGRGKFLDCEDKRVSRKHGELQVTTDTICIKSLHQNPCFYKKKGSLEIKVLNKGCTVELHNRDEFGLLPDSFWFQLILCPTLDAVETSLENTQPMEETITSTEPNKKETYQNVIGSTTDDDELAIVDIHEAETQYCDTPSPTLDKTDVQSPNNNVGSPSTLQNDVGSPSIVQNNVGSPSIVQNNVGSPSIVQNNVGSPSIVQNNVGSPSTIQNDVPSPTTMQNDVASPSTIQNDVGSPSIVQNDVGSLSLIRNNVGSPSIVQNNVGSPSLIQNNVGSPSFTQNETASDLRSDSPSLLPSENPDTSDKNPPSQCEESPNKRCHSPDSTDEPKKIKVEPQDVKQEPTDSQPGSSADQGNASGSSNNNNANPGMPPAQNANGRERCMYGAQCYRKNPVHKAQFAHPSDPDWGAGPQGVCPYGRLCARRDPRHWRDHSHPPGTNQPRPDGTRPARQKRPTTQKKRRQSTQESDDEDGEESLPSQLIVTGKRARKTVQRQNWSGSDLDDENDDPFQTDGEEDEWKPGSDSQYAQDD